MTEAQRESSAEVEKGADKGQEYADNEECAEFAERIHQTKSKSGMRAESKSGEQQLSGSLRVQKVGFRSRREACTTRGAGVPELGLLNIY